MLNIETDEWLIDTESTVARRVIDDPWGKTHTEDVLIVTVDPKFTGMTFNRIAGPTPPGVVGLPQW